MTFHTQRTSPFRVSWLYTGMYRLHTQPWEYIDSAATYRMLLKWHTHTQPAAETTWYSTNLMQYHPDAVTDTIDWQHTQQSSPFKHTQPWEHIDSVATYIMLLKWYTQRTRPLRLTWCYTSIINWHDNRLHQHLQIAHAVVEVYW